MSKLQKPRKRNLAVSNSDITHDIRSASDAKITYKTYDHAFPTNLLEFPRESHGQRVHPTQKPVALAEYLIRTYTKEGDLVVDDFLGSGTSMVAARKLGRRGIGIELDPSYVRLAYARIIAACPDQTNQK
jgi:site-specific DNA-methyltransferase (adenine-specific)